MTTTADTGAASVNGVAPGGGQQQQQAPGEYTVTIPGASAAETLMGLIGIAFAVGLLAIGIDLVTGGAISRMFGAPAEAGSDNSGG